MSADSPELPIGYATGSRIAGYRLEEQIGRGGMAVVFRAHDERLDRQVALKILVPELAADTAFRQRFIRESRAAAAVDDPHIIPVFEAGESGGVLFIAMRLVRGGDVRSLVRQAGPLPPGRVTEIVSQVASALDAAHQYGLVHRDVKPGNMLLGVIGNAGRPDHVYLSDFGLSKGSLEVSGLTGTGQFLGTLDYIAPEQIAGRPVDGRADQYALACTAFELLSGAPPFAREEAMAVMYAQLSEPPPPVTSPWPGLPAAVNAVFGRALAKVPAERYASCRDFADAVRAALVLRPYDAGPGAMGQERRPQTEVVGQAPDAGAAELTTAGTEAWPGPDPWSAEGGSGPAVPGGPLAGAPPRSPTGHPPAGSPPQSPTGRLLAGPPPQSPTGQPVAGPPPQSPTGRFLTGPPPQPHTIVPGPAERPGGQTAAAAGWNSGPGSGAPGQAPWEVDPAAPGPARGRGARPRWPAAIVAGLVVLAAAGGGVAFLASRHQAPSTPASAHRSAAAKTHPHKQQPGGRHIPPKTAFLAPPQCGSAIGQGRSFGVTPASVLTVPLPPYGAIVTADLSYTFVALPTAIEVLRNKAGIPAGPPVRTIPIPDHPHAQVITSDGRYLVTATDHGATVIRVSAAERPGPANPIAGELASGLSGNPGGDDLILSPDNQFVFIAMRYADKIGVFNLGEALHHGFGPSDLVGYFTAGVKPHGMAISPDGRWLYVTSRFARPGSLEGLITVLRVRKAELYPDQAKVSSAIAGCGAYRVITSADGNVLWVIAQGSNSLVGFSAATLRTEPRHAVIARVPIGAIPLDEVLVNGGTRLIVTDNAGANLAVVSPAAALARSKHALVGYIRTTALPRFFAFETDGPVVLLVTGDRSGQVRAIRLGDLP